MGGRFLDFRDLGMIAPNLKSVATNGRFLGPWRSWMNTKEFNRAAMAGHLLIFAISDDRTNIGYTHAPIKRESLGKAGVPNGMTPFQRNSGRDSRAACPAVRQATGTPVNIRFRAGWHELPATRPRSRPAPPSAVSTAA